MYNNSAQFTLRWRMELVFLVHWLPQWTLVPSFFFPSFFLSSIQDISGYVRCIKACAGIHGYAQVCAGVQECAGVCPAMCSYARVCASVHVCEGVYGSALKCLGVCECLCGMNFQNTIWRIESLHRRTFIPILYKFF